MSETMQSAGLFQSGEDHRRHERLPVEATVKYRIINRQTAEEVVGPGLKPDGQSVNISLSGLSISTLTPLTKGDFLKVEIGLPGMARPSRSLAEVMWSRLEGGQNLAGIRFMIFLNEADDSSIRRFIEQQKKGGGEA
jgi:hypothetical protein